MKKIDVIQQNIIVSTLMIVAIAFGAGLLLNYLTQGYVQREVELRLGKLVAAEQKKLIILTRDWKVLLKIASKKKILKQYAAATYRGDVGERNRLKPKLEKIFLEYSRLKPGLIKYIRFIGVDGKESILIKNGKVRHQYKDRNDRKYFTAAKASAFGVINKPTYRKGKNYTALDWSVAIGTNKQFHGVFTLTLNLSVIYDMTLSTQSAGVFDEYYLLDSSAQQLLGPNHQRFGKVIKYFGLKKLNDTVFLDAENNLITLRYIPVIEAFTVLVERASSLKREHSAVFQPIAIVLLICTLAIIVLTISSSLRIRRITQNSDQLEYDKSKLNEQVEIKTLEIRLALHDAEQATLAKSEFLANMSHEIRTPMNGVLGLLELIQNTKMNKIQKQYVSTAYISARSLLAIIDDVLDFSKIEAGKLDLETIDTNLRGMLKEIHNLYRQGAKLKNIAIKLDIASNVPQWVKVDPTRLRQVLNNLLSNAIKFTQNGSVTVRITSCGEETKPLVEFSVTDTGVGLSEKEQMNVFSSFIQADASTTRKFGGAGLGLSISKKIVEKFGSLLRLESEEGKGSRFYFTLQLELGSAPKREYKLKSAHRNATGVYTPGGEVILEVESRIQTIVTDKNSGQATILVVEDNVVNQIVAQGMLEELGFQSHVVSDGMQAIKAINDYNYAMIFMDMQMPVLDGIEATKVIRAGENDEHIPIVALTASVTLQDKEHCFDAGMDDYLSKPISIRGLKSKLDRWVDSDSKKCESASS